MDEETDFQRLLIGLRDRDPEAIGELYQRYGPMVRMAVRRKLHPGLRTRFDSLDLVQDVWVSFLAISPERYHFDTAAALVGYLSQVAYHKVVELFRQRFESQRHNIAREMPTGSNGMCDTISAPVATASQLAIADEEWERLLSRVPPGHQIVLRLLRAGHTYEEVAEASKVSLSTVNRIIRRLKELDGS